MKLALVLIFHVVYNVKFANLLSCNEEVGEGLPLPNQIQMSPTLAEIWQQEQEEGVQTKTKGLASKNPPSPYHMHWN